MSNFLAEILKRKQREVEALVYREGFENGEMLRRSPEFEPGEAGARADELKKFIDADRTNFRITSGIEPIRFGDALKKEGLSVIAEIKRKSPSKGVLNGDIDLVELAEKYVAGGAAAISVLTDGEGFGGSLEDLKAVIAACPGIPVLRKDFIIDLKQLYETARAGAHAVLLIVAALGQRLPQFLEAAKSYGLETLVEVHDLDELKLAQEAGSTIIGVNNRSLSTFEVSLEVAKGLSSHFLPHVIRVAESGIGNAEDAAVMRKVGYDAVLVGEALVKSKDPQSLIEEMRHAH